MFNMTKRALLFLLIVGLSCSTALAAATWTAQVNTSQEALNDVYFAAPRDGWAAGNGGAILNTTDRGGTWTAQASGTTNDLNGIHLIGASNGLAVGASRTVCKYDGSTWTASQMSLPADLDLTRVQLVGANTAWVTGGLNFSGSLADFRNLFSTTDGGLTWVSTTVRNTAEASTILNYLYSLYFFDALNGWLVGINNDAVPAGKVFATTDGGAGWADISPLNAENVVLRDVYFVSTLEGWAAGGDPGTGCGYIYHTTSGGLTWETECISSSALFTSVDGSNDSSIWASAQANLFKYSNNSWSDDYTPVSSGRFNRVHVQDQWNVWAVGGLLTAEGGPKRYIYKYVVEPSDLTADKALYISPTYYDMAVAFSGDGIQTNSSLTIDALAGLTIRTVEAVYQVTEERYKLVATIRVDPGAAQAGTYTYILANPDDGSSAAGTITLRQSPASRERPFAIPVPRQVFDPASDDELSLMIRTPGEIEDVVLDLLIYRPSDRQIAYRRRFTADFDGYTYLTINKLTDLGVLISEGVYNAIVLHPKYGKIGSGMIVVHYSR